MAEGLGVLREVQFNTEGEWVLSPARASRRSKVVKDDSAAVGATKADRKMAVARNKDVATFFGEIGASKAKLANKKAAGTSMAASWSDFAATKADVGNKEAAGIFTGEIGGAKAESGNKEAAGIFSGEIGVAKAETGNKEAVGTFTSEIGVTKALTSEIGVTKALTSEIGVTKALTSEIGVAKALTSEIGVTKALTSEIGVTKALTSEIGVTKAVVGTSDPLSGIEKPKEERKAVPGVMKERVPESHIARIKARPLRRIPPLSADDDLFTEDPSIRATIDAGIAHNNYLVDMEQDCLRQHNEKGYAEVGVDLSSGVKRMFILPNY